ncbi:hypothetical protein RND81_09G208800 [Saponaria officinalis]|uniref:Uncharacterized protein n=1 Tax=Saponaria officinalis TaxID=3572 RepID=A0AAW1IQD6_SAPOF
MDDRHEKLAYVILNETYEAEVEKSLEKFQKLSNRNAAQKVFDEMPEPVLCESQIVSCEEDDAHKLFDANEMIVSDSGILQQEEVVCGAQLMFDKLSEPILISNIDQIAITGDDHSLLNEIDEIRPGVNGVPEPYIGDVPDYVRTAHTLFHTMPVRDFILEMAKVAKNTQEENEDMVGAHQLLATMPEPTEQTNASQTKCQTEVINNETASSKVFDELTLPTFIKEMAQAASFVEESTPVSEIKADAKGFKGNSYLANDPHVFVFDLGVSFLHINEIEIGPCANFLGLISGWKAHVNYKEVHSWGKYRSYTQFALLDQLKKVSYFRGDFTKPPILKLCKCSDMLILSPSSSPVFMMLVNVKYEGILQRDIDLSTTWICVSFGPGSLESGIKISFFTTTLEDKGDFRGEEDTSRPYNWELFDTLTLCAHFNASRTKNGHMFLTFVFDPEILLCQSDLWDIHLHNSWFYSEPSLGFCVGHLTVYVLDAYFLKLLLLCKAHTIYHVSLFVPALTTMTTIPEDNGDFTEVRVICQWRTIWIEKCDEKYLIMCCTWLNLLKGVAIMQGNFVRFHMFDGLIKLLTTTLFRVFFKLFKENLKVAIQWLNKVVLSLILNPAVLKYNLSQVETIKESYSSGEDDLTLMTTVTSTSYLVSVVGLNSDEMLYLMFLSHHENDHFQSGVAGYVLTLHHGLVTINFKKMSRSLPNHFFGHVKQPPALGHSLVNIHSHSLMDYTTMLLGYGYQDQNASIFIFDPGGFKCWLKMMKILEAYQNNGRNSEDYQIYVFDPGGPLIRLVMDALVTNPKPGMRYATSSFKHRLSLILEDKDHFKRRVLIHIKMRLRVAWSLYLLFLISQVISSL